MVTVLGVNTLDRPVIKVVEAVEFEVQPILILKFEYDCDEATKPKFNASAEILVGPIIPTAFNSAWV